MKGGIGISGWISEYKTGKCDGKEGGKKNLDSGRSPHVHAILSTDNPTMDRIPVTDR
jgi:hypothetical protein